MFRRCSESDLTRSAQTATPSMTDLRFGVLGTARITENALIAPTRGSSEASVVAVASREPERAQQFAKQHEIRKVCNSYEALVCDADVDAVYIPLPNGLHARWTIAALEAGKHVLCEKPFASNADEASVVAEKANDSGLVVMEAFHYRYHPLADRMLEIVREGEIGSLQRVDAVFAGALRTSSDIRYDYELGGGALMDAGCYAIHMIRSFGGDEPRVTSAHASLRSEDIDVSMAAELAFPSGVSGAIVCSLRSPVSASLLRVVGDRGDLWAVNPVFPHFDDRLYVSSDGRDRVERLGRRPTYEYQLDAFCDAVLRAAPALTPPRDSLANARIIDNVYRAAGMRPRGTRSEEGRAE
jgi:predicted dehydrogenase